MNAEEELARIDSLRVTCPTCNGEARVWKKNRNMTVTAVRPRCPDCPDGRMSWEGMAAIVARVFLVKEPSNHGGEYGDGWRACIDRLRSVRP